MKKLLILACLLFSSFAVNSQSCEEILDYVESKGYGSSYYSYDSDAISEVTFYDIIDENYNTYYFAVVEFASSYTKYIYQVSSNTESNYSLTYYDSAGDAFWEFIYPYSDVLGCSPSFN